MRGESGRIWSGTHNQSRSLNFTQEVSVKAGVFFREILVNITMVAWWLSGVCCSCWLERSVTLCSQDRKNELF